MNLKSVLKPEGSIMASIATVGGVTAVYSLSVGSIADVHVTEANHPALNTSRKKAGYTAFALVSGLFLITRDGNVATLGYATIVAMELAYRHGIMVAPATGRMTKPDPNAYAPAGSAYPAPTAVQAVA